ncbi:MAG TPA: hypothetical protein VFI22_07910, partial [Thermomicrobiales bacterium]|nr:hypothetical protein [Thermomicrobiales bacterium]
MIAGVERTPVAVAAPAAARAAWAKRGRRLAGAIVWHGVLIVVCAVVLIPIVMVVLGSFKSVDEFFATPYALPRSFDLDNYRKAWNEANLQIALRNSIVATTLGVAFSTGFA